MERNAVIHVNFWCIFIGLKAGLNGSLGTRVGITKSLILRVSFAARHRE